MTKNDILAEIEYYKKQLLSDPAGSTLYNAMIEVLESDLAKRARIYKKRGKNKRK